LHGARHHVMLVSVKEVLRHLTLEQPQAGPIPCSPSPL